MVKVGLIGAGGWGKNHARTLYELGALYGVYDIDDERRKEFAKKYQVRSFDTLDELVTSDIDGAVVATPTATHVDILMKLVESGKNVLVEKPFVAAYKDGAVILDRLSAGKGFVGVGYIERFNPAVGYVKEAIDSKRLGKLILLEFHREGRWPNRIGDVGVVLDTMVHDIDTSRYLTGMHPSTAFARVSKVRNNVEDLAVLLLDFGEGVTASMVANWITPKKDRRLSAVFEEGIIQINFITQEIRVDTESETVIPRLQTKEPLMLEDQAFIDSILGKRKFPIQAKDAIENNRIAEAALLSAERGIPVFI